MEHAFDPVGTAERFFETAEWANSLPALVLDVEDVPAIHANTLTRDLLTVEEVPGNLDLACLHELLGDSPFTREMRGASVNRWI